MKPGERLLALCGLLMLLGSCATPEQAPLSAPVSLDEVQLNVATRPPVLPLAVSISRFDAAPAETGGLRSAVNQVRSVERRFLPYQLKLSLERSGWFGPVRVLPVLDPGAELTVRGVILSSDGTHLALAIQVEDATGRVWLERDYLDSASVADYTRDPVFTIDPFQGLYDQIANDMIRVLADMGEQQIRQIASIAEMRYAAMLSPEYFGRFLNETGDRYGLSGLPAASDPLMERVMRIRASEHLFADSADAHYESLYRRLGPTYAWWRHYSNELISGNNRLEQMDATRGATPGTWYALERVYKIYQESRMNEDALRELTDSFDRETAPTVTDLAGRVVELTGTLTEQHQAWRQLMRQYYEETR
ncbi:MAG: hypothetical protein O3B72_09515 [Proteobacteria bacterium]|nr:hypothetical protein [Pseudomonadota bacterium]